MATATVDHGKLNDNIVNLTVSGSVDGTGIDVSTFGANAAGATTVSNASVKAVNSQVVVFPTNAAAGLLLQTKSC